MNDYFDTYGYYNVSEDYVMEEVLADYYAGIDIYAGTENAQKDIGARSRNVQKTVGSRGEALSEEAGGEVRASREDALVTNRDEVFDYSGMTDQEAGAQANEVVFSRETDSETLDFLNNQDTVTVYRAMQVMWGRLYPPMAAKVRGEDGKRHWVEPTEYGQWYRSDEHPELVDENGKFLLDKGDGTSLKAAYNPYFHTSNSPLNDQFTSAYRRKNLVIVECSIPKSELTSGYRAEGAKDTVGEMNWHSGPVSSKLKGDKARRVTLSRWVRVERIVPEAEAAQKIAELLDGTGLEIPANTVTPALREELEKQGVKIGATRGTVKASRENDVIVDGEVSPETVRAQLQDIYDHPQRNHDYTFPIFKETPFVYRFATRIPGVRSFVMHGNKAAMSMMMRNEKDHGLGVEGLMEAIKGLEVPDYIVYQRTGRNAGHYVSIVNGKDGPYIAVVDLDNYRSGDRGSIGGQSGSYDVLITVYNNLDKNTSEKYDSFEDYILDLIGNENNDVVFDKEKDEASLRVAISEQRFGRAEDASSKGKLAQTSEEVKTSRETDAAYLAAVEAGDMESAQRMVDEATRLAGSILEGAERLDENTALHREIRAAIRSQKLSFSEQGNIPDYNQWRKANFGRLTISKDGVPVETRWQELQILVRKTGPGDGGLSSVARSDIQGSCLFLSLRRVRRQDLSVGTGPDALFYPTKPGSVPTGGSICFSNRNIPSDPSPVS